MTAGRTVICRLDELADPGSRAMTLGTGAWPLRGFAVRRGAHVFGYVNRCPHAGHPLDWHPDRFLSIDESHIQCASHGALFAIETGRCVAGPCTGRQLTPIALAVDGEEVVFFGDPDELARRYA